MMDAAFAQALENAIRPVGRYIAHERKDFSTSAVETKSLNALVSYVDQEAEKQLVEALHELLPEAGFLAEEGRALLPQTVTGTGWWIRWTAPPISFTEFPPTP
jgi:myo-inositol-1(or 4)-monophosphatase